MVEVRRLLPSERKSMCEAITKSGGGCGYSAHRAVELEGGKSIRVCGTHLAFMVSGSRDGTHYFGLRGRIVLYRRPLVAGVGWMDPN